MLVRIGSLQVSAIGRATEKFGGMPMPRILYPAAKRLLLDSTLEGRSLRCGVFKAADAKATVAAIAYAAAHGVPQAD